MVEFQYSERACININLVELNLSIYLLRNYMLFVRFSHVKNQVTNSGLEEEEKKITDTLLNSKTTIYHNVDNLWRSSQYFFPFDFFNMVHFILESCFGVYPSSKM